MNYSTLSLSELKALAISNNAVPTGDKRSKKAWIDALELALQPTVSEDVWVAPEMPSHAEQEAISHAADVDEEEAVDFDQMMDWCDQYIADIKAKAASLPPVKLDVTDYIDVPEIQSPSNKKGAATVFGSLLCILILTIQAVLCIGGVIVQAAIHLKNLFGSYNPDYDLLGQLHDMVRQRKLDIACA